MAAKKAKGVTKLSCRRVSRNPHMTDEKWQADHWSCTLSRKGKRMRVVFSKGKGHHGKEPTTGEIIESLAMDASGYEGARGFEDWAADYGYDVGSIRARRTFKAVQSEARRLRRFLGDKLYERVVHGKR
jgi:hypothetical protein